MAPLIFTDQEFNKVLHEAQELYDLLKKIRCPYLKADVHFTSEGLNHLRRKSWNRGRNRSDQFMRLKYVACAAGILSQSHTVQGVEETYEWERRHKHGRWEKLLILVTYYEFVAVISGRRFKVIVKQLPGGERIFWSLIPFWRKDEQGRRVLHDGDPALD